MVSRKLGKFWAYSKLLAAFNSNFQLLLLRVPKFAWIYFKFLRKFLLGFLQFFWLFCMRVRRLTPALASKYFVLVTLWNTLFLTFLVFTFFWSQLYFESNIACALLFWKFINCCISIVINITINRESHDQKRFVCYIYFEQPLAIFTTR